MSGNLFLVGVGLLLVHAYNKKQKAKPPKIYYTKKVPGNYNAVTIPPIGIFIKQDQRENAALLNHEKIHWKQYQRDGLVNFYAGYFSNHIKYGYDRNPYEIEARANEDDHCKENYTACVRAGLAKTIHDPNFRM